MEDLDMSKLEETFRGKRVLVTGHTGFKGSWLSICLLRAGAKVCGYALAPRTDRDNFVVSKLDKRLEHHEGDVRDRAALFQAFSIFRPDIVFHLAAQPLVRYSYENPADTFSTNVLGTVNVMDAIRTVPECRTAVIVTSDKCYENQEWIWGYRETDRLGGHDPYSASKAAAEIAVSAYRRSFFRPEHRGIATARAGNVIGGGDWCPDRLIPDCIRALEKGEMITLRNPLSTRPWQHVLEPISGYLKLAQALHADPSSFDDAWNFGPDPVNVYTVQKVVEMAVQHWGGGLCESAGGKSLHEAGLLALDISKAHQKLNWRPAWTTPRAVKETVAWYRDSGKGDAYDFCVRQIESYEKGELEHP